MRAVKAPRAILFDKDGTLLDFHASWQPVNAKAIEMAAKGDVALASRIGAAGGLDPVTGRARPNTPLAAGTTTEIATTFISAGSPFELVHLTREIDRIFQAGALTAVPVLDLKVFFTRLKALGLGLGIASSDSEAAICATAERFEFAAMVDFIAGYDSGHGTKPGPGMLTAFARATRLEPAEIAVVGDNLHDMEMAERGGAGLRIAVLTGTGTREELTEAADLVLDSVADLERVLFPAG
jgi:phosphoglycolate phosphatase